MEKEKDRRERVRLEYGVSLLKVCSFDNSSGMLVSFDKLSKILLTLNDIRYCKTDLSSDISILMEKYEAGAGDNGVLLKESDFQYVLKKMDALWQQQQ